MSGFDYRVASQFVLTVSGNGQQQGYMAAATPPITMPGSEVALDVYITAIDLQLIGPSAVAVASVVGVPTTSGGLGFHVQQGPAMPYVNETFDPPLACIPGATAGLFLPTPPVAGGTWNAHVYGFLGNPNA